jgi:hypothetical protein
MWPTKMINFGVVTAISRIKKSKSPIVKLMKELIQECRTEREETKCKRE